MATLTGCSNCDRTYDLPTKPGTYRCTVCGREYRISANTASTISPVVFDTSLQSAYASDQPGSGQPQVTHHCPECEAHARLVEMMRRREAPYIEQWRRETGRHDALPDYGDMLKWLMEKVEEARWELGKYIAAYAAGAGRETGGRLPTGDQEQQQ